MTFALTARPSPGSINTPFGPRPKPTPSSPAIHYGQDYGWGNGKDIFAAADGVVVEGDGAGLSGAYGNRTRIDHGGGFETWYCHQSVRLVRKGQRVAAGQKIGVQGATGNVTGVHLHFEVRRNGVAVDPAPYFAAASAKPAIPTSGSKPVPAPTSSATPIQEDDMPTAQEVAAAIFEGLTSQDPASPGKQARDAIAAAAADYTLTRLVPASGDGWGKQARDAIGKSAADYAIFALATAEPGSEAAQALARIADATRPHAE